MQYTVSVALLLLLWIVLGSLRWFCKEMGGWGLWALGVELQEHGLWRNHCGRNQRTIPCGTAALVSLSQTSGELLLRLDEGILKVEFL